VCGGWAIDLFLDRLTREHEDLEVAIFREHQHALRAHYPGWGPFKSISGWLPWAEGEFLELPIHQILFRPPDSGPPPDPWEPVDEERQFFLDDRDGETWICRRDPRLRRPVPELTMSSERGVSIVVPEVQLLYKAKHHLEKDEQDFRATLPLLSDEQRSWLRDALELVHPGDPWHSRLG
jgi:hypothetical protein